MNHRLFRTLVLASSLGFLVGCQSVERRIKEKPEVYAGLDVETQYKIQQGIIDLGFTPDMVYLALGEPSQKRETMTENGRTQTWIYNTYYNRYDGSQMVGYHRRVYYDPYLRSYRVYYRPAFIDTYQETAQENIRIIFKDGKATVIEQAEG